MLLKEKALVFLGMDRMQNSYVLWPDLILFLGALPKQVAQHQHPIIQLIIGLEKPFLKKSTEGVWEPYPSLLVAPNIGHECDAADQHILSLSVDPDSSFGGYLVSEVLQSDDFISFPKEQLSYFDKNQVAELVHQGNHEALRQYVIGFFGGDQLSQKTHQKDDRIETVTTYLRNHLEEQISTQELCRLVFLSESRLLHLFKQEMGLPIRNYILWLRVTRALEQMMEGRSLTYAAQEAGFFDSSHMSRTFVRMLGINPAEIIKNSKFIQVSVVDRV